MEETRVLIIVDTLTFLIYLFMTELIKMKYISNIVPHNGCWRILQKKKQVTIWIIQRRNYGIQKYRRMKYNQGLC